MATFAALYADVERAVELLNHALAGLQSIDESPDTLHALAELCQHAERFVHEHGM